MGTFVGISNEAEEQEIGYQASDYVPSEIKNRKTKKRAKLELPSSENNTLRSSAEETREEDDGSSSSDDRSGSSSEEESESSEEDSAGADSNAEAKGSERADSTAFGRAFRKIMKKKLPDTSLVQAMGPMLSSHKQLIAKKLEETATMEKAKSEKKKEKQAIREKGHTNIEIYPSARDRELIKLATRGVVKLFNAVSKAQSIQETTKTSGDNEGKEVVKRSKAAFLASLQSGSKAGPGVLNPEKKRKDISKNNNEEQPEWTALRDDFMLGKSRMKDWDKEPAEEDGPMKAVESSDDESLSE